MDAAALHHLHRGAERDIQMAVKILPNGDQVTEISRILNSIEGGVDMDKVGLHARDSYGRALAAAEQECTEQQGRKELGIMRCFHEDERWKNGGSPRPAALDFLTSIAYAGYVHSPFL